MEKGNIAEDKKGNYPKTPKQYTLKEKARLTHRPLAGFEYNPLLKLPRNIKCPCQSGLKFKKCCLNTLPIAVKKWEADKMKEYFDLIKQGKYKFDRKHNRVAPIEQSQT